MKIELIDYSEYQLLRGAVHDSFLAAKRMARSYRIRVAPSDDVLALRRYYVCEAFRLSRLVRKLYKGSNLSY